MPKPHPLAARQGISNYRIDRNLQERTLDTSAMVIECFVIVIVLTVMGFFLHSWLRKNAQGLKMMWKYRDLEGMDYKLQQQARWSWWLYAGHKQRGEMAELIEATRKQNGYYNKYAQEGGPPGFWDYLLRLLVSIFFFSWMFWSFSEWLWPSDAEEEGTMCDEEGCVFQMAGLSLCVWMGSSSGQHLAEFLIQFFEGPQLEFFLGWFANTCGHIATVTPIVMFFYGCTCVWKAVFGDFALSGPDIMVLITTALAAACYYVNRDGFTEEEGQWLAHARTGVFGAWYDQGFGRTPLNQQFAEMLEAQDERLEDVTVKLTKAQRKALGKEREAQKEAERQARQKVERKARKEEQALAREASAAGLRKRRIAQLQAKKDAHTQSLQRKLKRLEELDDEADDLRRRRDEAEFRYQKWLARAQHTLLDGDSEELWSDTASDHSFKGDNGDDAGPSHADHVDSADLAAQTLLNKEEAERKRRVREQREKEKAAQKEKEYSEAGPSHKEGAPKWVDAPLDEGDRAKREAEKVASLLRKQEQQRERVKEKEAREKRESERLQNLKTGKSILRGNVQNRLPNNNNNVQRSSLQPLREDEPSPTLTLADVALGIQENSRFQERDDDLESVATTAVPAMLTQHAWERAEERDFTAYQIKHTLKYGRVEEGNRPGTLVHNPCHECHPKLVTDAEGTIITVLRLRRA